MSIELLESQISGLKSRLTELRSIEALFHKAQGLDEQAEKSRKEGEDMEAELQAAKETLSELRAEKAKATEASASALAATMCKVLPEGHAIFEITDAGEVFIGWSDPDGERIPYAGLSGGQRVSFDQALCFALLGKGEKVILMEGAELDEAHLRAALEHFSHLSEDTQVILSTCHAPAEIPGGWNVVEVK